MDWTQLTIFFVGVFGMWLWQRTEANADRRQASAETSACRAELLGVLKAIQDEIKDFHGRLCALEEKHRQKQPPPPKRSGRPFPLR